MLALLALLSVLGLVAGSCPSGLTLQYRGECIATGASTWSSQYYDAILSTAVSNCQGKQAHLPIIHDNEELSFFAAKFANQLVLGITCDVNTNKWEWTDGSPIDFKPPPGHFNTALESDCKASCVWYISSKAGDWAYSCAHSTGNFDAWCAVTPPPPATQECDNFDDDSEDGVCYHVGATVESWQDAQKECREFGANLASIHSLQENSFIRRLAVSKGITNGVYLGGTIKGKGKDDYGWIDGTDWDYTYFMPGFPVDGLGNCLVMDTFGTSGQWMNKDCRSKLAVACTRLANASVTDACGAGPWEEGQIIYTPGYPYDASLGCDFFLTVSIGQRVEVTVHQLEANTCCDHLLLSDDYFGGHLVANLTGEISNKTYTSTTSNIMRVSWNPSGGIGVRGAMFSYRAI